MGNNNAHSALIRGGATTDRISAMAATFWSVLTKYGIDVRLRRVSSKLNISDHTLTIARSAPVRNFGEVHF